MNEEKAALIFQALGNPARLAVLQLLVRAGHDGLNIGKLRSLIDIPASTLSHHISSLKIAGILTQEKKSREVINRVNFDNLEQALNFLTHECCKGL